MKLYNERTQIREFPALFRQWVSIPGWGAARWTRAQIEEMVRRIDLLDVETATAADVETITGSGYYVRPMECAECGTATWDIVHFGENDTAICLECLQAAVRLARKAPD